MYRALSACAALAVGALAAGCGGVNHPPGELPDASLPAPAVDAGVTPVDAIAAARCDPTKPFGAPVPLAGINSANRDIGAVFADELTLYFASDRGGSLQLYRATRATPTSPFTTPQPITPVDVAGSESAPFLTGDQLTLYYSYISVGATNGHIFATKRTSATTEFTAGQGVGSLNSTSDDDGDPTVTADGSLVYFDSTRTGGPGASDIWLAARKTDGTFTAPQVASELDSAAYDAHPRISPDGLTIYFSSMRTTGGALAGTDIWMANRVATSVPFGSPQRVAELSTSSNESPAWISADGCDILIQTDRPGGSGGQDIWEAVKPL